MRRLMDVFSISYKRTHKRLLVTIIYVFSYLYTFNKTTSLLYAHNTMSSDIVCPSNNYVLVHAPDHLQKYKSIDEEVGQYDLGHPCIFGE